MVYHRTNAQIKTAPIVGPWRCNVCGEKFVDPKAHVDHMGSHSDEYPSACPLCLSRYRNSNELASHDCIANNKSRKTSNNSNNSNSNNINPPPAIDTPPPHQTITTETQIPLPIITPHIPPTLATETLPVLPTVIPPVQAQEKVTYAAPSESLAVSPVSKKLEISSESASSPAIEDDPDEEDIFEAAQNPQRRSRSISLEANNNKSGKDEFIVVDPWAASSALMIIDSSDEETPLSLPDASCKFDSAPSTSHHARKEVESSPLKQHNLKDQRFGKRVRTPNSRYFNDESLILHKQSLHNFSAGASNSNKRPSVRIVDVPSPNSSKSSSNRSSTPFSSSTSISEEIDMAQDLAMPERPPTLPLNAPLLDLMDLVAGSEEYEISIADQAGEIYEDDDSIYDDNSSKSDVFPLYDLKCIHCQLRFVDYLSWQKHIVKKHIRYGPIPSVVMSKLSVVEVESVGTYKVSSDSSGNVSICAKRTEYDSDSSESSNVERSASETELSSSSETRKEALKLTLCRREGQYELKRKSTDAESNASSNDDTRKSSPLPIVEYSNRSEKEREAVLPDLDVEGMSQSGNRTEEEELPKKTDESILNKNVGSEHALSIETVGKPQLGFKRRFRQAVHTVQRNMELQKKLLSSGRELPTANKDNGEARQATTAVDKNPMTSSTITSINSMPSLVSSPQHDRLSATSTAGQPTNANHSDTGMPAAIAATKTTSPMPTAPNKETVVVARGNSESGSIPGSPSISNKSNKESSQEAGSPSTGVISDLGINSSTRSIQHQAHISSKESVDTMQSEPLTSAQKSCDSGAVITSETVPELQRTESVDDKELEPVCDDEDGLVIDVPEEGQSVSIEKPDTSQVAKDMTESTIEKAVQDKSRGGEGESSESRGSDLVERRQEKELPSENERGSINNNNNQEEEDFPCSQCDKVFTCDEDLQTHFSENHIRLAHSTIIQEPESPFPTITVRGTSSIFEDEVEESEPYPVRAAQESPFPSNTLSSLLSRRHSAETERLMVEPIISSYMHSLGRGVEMPHNVGAPSRPPFPVPGRSGIHINPPLHMRHLTPADFMARQGMRPGHRMPVAAAQQQSRMQMPYRPGPGYPTTLHQALVNQQQHSPTSQSNIAPPQRPQLRPMPNASHRGVPPSQLPSRPVLTRVPPPMQASAPFPHNPQSILRASPPLSHAHQQQQQQQQQQQHQTQQPVFRTSPQISPHQQHETELYQKLKHRLQQVNEQMDMLTKQSKIEHNQVVLTRIAEDKAVLSEHSDQLVQQLKHMENQQQQQHQQQLQRQHLHQLQLQQQQHQQMRQQQLQQHQQRRPGNVLVSNPAGPQKRPSIENMDAVIMANQPKQQRVEGHQFIAERSNAAPHQTNSDLSVKLPNGVTLSVLPQSVPSPPASSNVQSVAPGMHSGGSSGSRHSSAPVSPAMVSPGTMASRLANSGITLTPASPVPLPLTPPANPVLSPISDCTSSPRGSPRIPMNTVIQRVPSTGSPVTKTNSPPTPPHAQPNVNFAIPRPPTKPNNNGSNNAAVVTNPNAERPERPPTIDLTDDEVLMHNAHMRATGGGSISQEQIKQHQAVLQRLRAQGMTGQPPVPPNLAQNNNTKAQCPHCHSNFVSIEALNEHIVRIHRQNPQPYPNPFVRQPQVAVRRPSPSNVPSPNQSNSILAHRLDSPPSHQPIRGGAIPRGAPPPSNSQLLQQMRSPVNPLSRTVEHPTPARTSDEGEKFVIPLLNLAGLDMPKLRALNDIGVVSFVPLQGLSKLGIPIMRLRSDVSLGHFPHDSAIEIGPVRRFAESGGNSNSHRSLLPPSITPPNRSIGVPRQVQQPPAAHQGHHHLNRSNQQPVASPGDGNGNMCMDRNCPDLIRRPSPGSIHHGAGSGGANNVPTHSISLHSHHNSASQALHQQQQQSAAHHESFLGSHGQLIVTPVNRH